MGYSYFINVKFLNNLNAGATVFPSFPPLVLLKEKICPLEIYMEQNLYINIYKMKIYTYMHISRQNCKMTQ